MSTSTSSKPDVNLWSSSEHSKGYLKRADSIPHRREGEATLLEFLPEHIERFLDLGSGGGRLLALVKEARPNAEAVAVDFSAAMLEILRDAYRGDAKTSIVEHDLSSPLPEVGKFDAVVSSFAIHHVSHERKRALYGEIFERLNPGGAFLNLEHVASATTRLHEGFLAQLDLTPETEDPSNKLLDLELQLKWLREIGFTDVDCHWKWRELALLAGTKPESAT
ncbi:MAG TPA: class I SAM-dependent methyltransferase [Candidatus Eremiobacteraceae bacterium]|nr:class I SAM-dependent methyltransferase [Candidatus Eremiobacteraceae bacterium]